MLTYFIKETNQASKNGINFTDKETDAILEVLKADMSPEEIKRIDTIKRMVSMLSFGKERLAIKISISTSNSLQTQTRL